MMMTMTLVHLQAEALWIPTTRLLTLPTFWEVSEVEAPSLARRSEWNVSRAVKPPEDNLD